MSLTQSIGAPPESEVEPWQLLAPCPSCGSMPHDAPEGVKQDGSPHWTFHHCFRCGHRPGTNVAVDVAKMQAQFQAFLKWQEHEIKPMLYQEPGSDAWVPVPSTVPPAQAVPTAAIKAAQMVPPEPAVALPTDQTTPPPFPASMGTPPRPGS